ncbi:MAG: PTS fructose transporter subunit IIA [Rhodospirillaceae bacterium]|nr:PTS fructose transporter subunit IIA [Rhodospirillaceae bacterium]|tara:strand:- start:167 stop:592 length:426 start_codon:yes stop_codon:yes gene_type:complete
MTNNDGAPIGIVLVTHGGLADELRQAMEHVVGAQEMTATVCIAPDDDMEQRRRDILESVESVESGCGVVVLTDMFGGTPSNLAISIMENAQIEVLAGVNLPMLVKLASVRSNFPLAEAVLKAREAGQKYIMVASQVLRGTP